MEWVADHGRSRCCALATDEERLADPTAYQCEECPRLQHWRRMSVRDQVAWETYQTLCGRTVGLCQAHGVVLDWTTEGWSSEDKLDLLARLDLMLRILQPDDVRDRTQATRETDSARD